MEKIKKNKDILIFGSIVSAILIIIVVIQLKSTRFAYYWDYVGYYENSLSVIYHFGKSLGLGIKKVIYTLFYSDYNYLAAIPTSIIMAIFGKNRTTYTIGITICYYIPFIFIFLMTIKPLFEKSKYKNMYMVISILSCIPLLIYLNYMGYVDIGGLVIILLLFQIAKKSDFGIKNNIKIGTILMILFFFRRWYMFYIIAFLITLFGFDLYSFIKNGTNKETFLKYLKKYLTIGSTMLAIVGLTFILNFILFKNDPIFKLEWGNFYITKLLFNDYGKLYAGYNRPLSSDLIGIGNKFGYITITLVVFSIVTAIKNKKNIKEVCFLSTQMILCFVLFENTQSHDIHHYLLYVLNIMLIISYILVNSSKRIIKAIIASILCMNIILSIPIFNENSLVKALKKCLLINSIDLNVLSRDDLEEFEKVNEEITKLSEGGTQKIYINASSSVINDSMIYSYDKTTGKSFEEKSFLLAVSHVDSRDSIPTTLKEANIVMVTEPDQLHMVPQNQKVITYINNIFLDEQYSNILANKFENIKTMKIGEVNIHFYKKIDNITDLEYEEFIKKGKQFIQEQN